MDPDTATAPSELAIPTAAGPMTTRELAAELSDLSAAVQPGLGDTPTITLDKGRVEHLVGAFGLLHDALEDERRRHERTTDERDHALEALDQMTEQLAAVTEQLNERPPAT